MNTGDLQQKVGAAGNLSQTGADSTKEAKFKTLSLIVMLSVIWLKS